MNKRVLTILMSAFIVAALCSYLVYRAVGSRLGGGQHRTTRVIVASKDIALGTLLKDTDLSTTEITGAVPKGYLVRTQDVVGRGVVANIYEGEPIQENRLAAPGSGGGLAATIRQGMRACAVKVDDVVGVAGFVTPGMRVDVLISGTPPGAVDTSQGPKVKTLLQNIEVLSAGTDIQKDAEGKPHQVQVVNLLVTPEQAEDLSLASNQTRIQLVLRNPLDQELSKPPGTAMASLFADQNAAPVPIVKARGPVTVHAAPPKLVSRVYSIQVFNGSKRTEEKFDSSEGKQ